MFAGSEKVATFASAFETKRPVLSKTAAARPASDTANEMPPISIECKVLEKKLQKVLEFQKSSLPLQPRLRKTKMVLRSVASLRQTDSRRTMPKVGSTQGS